MNSRYSDDNFGDWEIRDLEDVEFYRRLRRQLKRGFWLEVQGESIVKRCEDCGRMVKIRPDYACCNGCAEVREQGGY